MDCTRFGGSVLRYAPEFGYDTNKTERLMSDMVEGLADRPPAFGIAELHLMCRRYAGFRPCDGFCVTDDNGKFPKLVRPRDHPVLTTSSPLLSR